MSSVKILDKNAQYDRLLLVVSNQPNVQRIIYYYQGVKMNLFH